jgi:hypothetical protein
MDAVNAPLADPVAGHRRHLNLRPPASAVAEPSRDVFDLLGPMVAGRGDHRGQLRRTGASAPS